MLNEKEILINSLINTKELLDVANQNFEMSGNSELSDYYSYQIKALKIQYDYLLKQIKLAYYLPKGKAKKLKI